MELIDGHSCPFCDQPIAGVALVEHYRARFDDAYGRLIAGLDQQVATLDRIERWWEDLKRVGGGNRKAFRDWEHVPRVARPEFGSVERGKDVAATVAALRTALAAKRAQPLERLSSNADLGTVRNLWTVVIEAIRESDEAIRRNNEHIDAYLATLSGRDPEALRQKLRSIDAAVRRHADDIRVAVGEKAKLNAERQKIERDKQTATERMKHGGEGRLQAFAASVNRHLQVLCADFRIEKLGTERVGGDAGVGYTLVVEAGSRSVTSGSEEWFAKVLSDGDRSTIALAVFMAHLDDVSDLANAILVFDDPMTSLDQMRQNATAELITELALRARQVIVLSHHDRFLHLVALDWRRHGPGGGHLVELELERSRRELRLWKHVESEHLRLLKEITDFVDSGHDDKADHIQGEIRKLLESEVRRRWPDLFTSERSALEPVVRMLRENPDIRRDTGLSVEDVKELDRLCAFGARGNHAQDHLSIDPADPVEVRSMARRTLDWVKR
jgi:wobble nucleotide-excising tRNase